MTILLTGASGFVGRHLLNRLQDHTVHALTRDIKALPADLRQLSFVQWHQISLENKPALQSLIREIKVTTCFHLAWDTQPGRYLDDKTGNLDLLQQSLSLYQSLIENNCEQIISLGTCAEYAIGNAVLQANSPLDPQTIYAAAKTSLSLLGSQLCKGTNTVFCWARLFYVYGPGEHPQRLVSGLLQKLMQGETFSCGTPTKKKDYLYIRDVASALEILMQKKASGIFNLSSGVGVTIGDIGSAAERAVGCQNMVRYGVVPERPWDPELLVGASDELKALGWTPAFDLESGLQDYVKTLRDPR